MLSELVIQGSEYTLASLLRVKRKKKKNGKPFADWCLHLATGCDSHGAQNLLPHGKTDMEKDH